MKYSGLKDFVESWALQKKNRGGLTLSLHPQGPPGCTELGRNKKYVHVFFSSAGLRFCRHQLSNYECHRPNWGMQGVEVLLASWNSQEKLGEGYSKVSTSQGPRVCIQRTPAHGQKVCARLPLGTSLLWVFCFCRHQFLATVNVTVSIEEYRREPEKCFILWICHLEWALPDFVNKTKI